ncbi:MAG: zinc ribbon domain-containing protein [SAR324 cluster bacterium]|nr:zinc ribbon domain-containing protein [SAR324 cluster bacterium]
MPIYEYSCGDCHHEFEELQKFSDSPTETCPACGKPTATRKVSASAFHLKGGGWYKDGYSQSGTSSEGKGSSTKATSSAESGNSGSEASKATPAAAPSTSASPTPTT